MKIRSYCMDRILDLGKGSHKLGREDSNCVNLSVFYFLLVALLTKLMTTNLPLTCL